VSELKFMTVVTDRMNFCIARGYLNGHFNGTTGGVDLYGSLPVINGGMIAKVVILDSRDDHDGVLLELTEGFKLYGMHVLFGDTINFS